MNKKMLKPDVDRVVRELYRQAKLIDWVNATGPQKTKMYAQWLTDPSIGDILLKWMSSDEARLWIKDGPMKEYARAAAGLGAFAEHFDSPKLGATGLVSAALGAGWIAVPESIGVKPLHCDAENVNQAARIYWGPPRDFKHLLWAALDFSHRNPGHEVIVVVLDTVARPIAKADRRKFEGIAKRCGVGIRFVHAL